MPLTKDQAQKMMDEQKDKLKKDPASLTDMLCENAKGLSNHQAAVSGKAAMSAQFKQMAGKFADFDIKHTVADVLNEGNLAIVDGTFVLTMGGKELDTGKWLNIWKNEGGSYKLLRSMNNTNSPHPAMPK